MILKNLLSWRNPKIKSERLGRGQEISVSCVISGCPAKEELLDIHTRIIRWTNNHSIASLFVFSKLDYSPRQSCALQGPRK